MKERSCQNLLTLNSENNVKYKIYNYYNLIPYAPIFNKFNASARTNLWN